MTKQELKKLVEDQVTVSVRRYVMSYLPIVVNEVVKDIVTNQMNEIIDALPESKSSTRAEPPRKSKVVNEIVKEEFEDWPTLGGDTLTTMVPSQVPLEMIMKLSTGQPVTAPRSMLDDGTIEESVEGFTGQPAPIMKDYSKFMKSLNQKVSQTRPIL